MFFFPMSGQSELQKGSDPDEFWNLLELCSNFLEKHDVCEYETNKVLFYEVSLNQNKWKVITTGFEDDGKHGRESLETCCENK